MRLPRQGKYVTGIKRTRCACECSVSSASCACIVDPQPCDAAYAIAAQLCVIFPNQASMHTDDIGESGAANVHVRTPSGKDMNECIMKVKKSLAHE